MALRKHISTTHQSLIAAIFCALLFFGCDDGMVTPEFEDEEEDEIINVDDADFNATDWTAATHSREVDPNMDEVFADGTVKRIDIVISADRWDSMLENMNSLYGTFGAGGRPGGAFASENPIFVPGEVFYNGLQWYRVGVRFKGNSSLQATWSQGNLKLSFKLDFDEFEDTYPQIDNQRFYGFKQLNLKNNYDDPSLIREKSAGDVFRAAGMVAPHSAFYAVYVDYGEGAEYFGLYTMVEEVDDSVIDTQFADNDGNLYKPDGDAATFASGSYDENELVKQTNEEDGDFSDVRQLFDALHDESRVNDPAAWRAGLEAIFDTDTFLKYLAINTTIQNWDTYGRMTHNYYLYHDSATGKLTWIPWDNNEALQTGKRGGSLSLSFSDLSSGEWPLIEYLYADPVYAEQYKTFVRETVDGPFEAGRMQAIYQAHADLLQPYAEMEEPGRTFVGSAGVFQSAIGQLMSHASSRNSTALAYLQ